MPGMYQGGDYDLAGFAVGAVERAALLPRRDIAAGDVVLGLASSGVHSNGFSLVRRIVAHRGRLLGRTGAVRADTKPGRGAADADAALCEILPRGDPQDRQAVKALAHITGGGFVENIPRVLPKGLAVAIDLRSRCRCCRSSSGWPRAGTIDASTRCCAPSIAASA